MKLIRRHVNWLQSTLQNSGMLVTIEWVGKAAAVVNEKAHSLFELNSFKGWNLSGYSFSSNSEFYDSVP